MKLPSWLLPSSPLKGSKSYTLKDVRGRTVEVQLHKEAFYLKAVFRQGPLEPWDAKLHGSPNVAWGQYSSFEECWNVCLEKLGGWEPVDGWIAAKKATLPNDKIE